MTRQVFIERYVVEFLAAYNATIYVEACMMGHHDRLRNPPIEDARHMAEHAWEAFNQEIVIPGKERERRRMQELFDQVYAEHEARRFRLLLFLKSLVGWPIPGKD